MSFGGPIGFQWISKMISCDTFSGKPRLITGHNYGKVHHFIAGKTHYFNGHFPQLCNKLPEGTPAPTLTMS